MALELNSNQNAVITALETSLEEAFMNGVTFESNPVISSVLNYFLAQYQPLGDLPEDVRAYIKASFKSTIAAYLKALDNTVLTWTNLTPNAGSGWAVVGGRPLPAYRKDLTKTVYLKGVVAGGTEFTTVTTLPSEAWPPEPWTVPVYGTIGGTQVLTAVEVGTTGNVVVPPSPVGTYTLLNLDGVFFRTA